MGFDLEQVSERNQEDGEQNNNVILNVEDAEVVGKMTGDKVLEPHEGMEFDSKEDAFSFYKRYANSVGFDTITKASRRSRISGKFIDAKFVCTRYGCKRGSNSSENAEPVSNEGGTVTTNLAIRHKRGRINRSWSKTDCKACMHVKRVQDGRWIIHNFIKEHNHEIYPNLQDQRKVDLSSSTSVSEKMLVTLSRQSGRMKKIQNEKRTGTTGASQQKLAIDEGDVQAMLEHLMYMQNENPYFVYAMDLNPEHGLRNVLWVDAKSRIDYRSFSDVVLFDVTYIKNEFKLQFAPFIGVNHHFQFLLLGCALLSDENKSSFSWAMRAWLRAMGGQAPKVILTDQDMELKEAVKEVFPHSRHCFCLWHILSKVQENLGYVTRKHDEFVTEFNKCVLKAGTGEQFERRWQKMVELFDLRNDLWIQSLYEDRERWVPAYMKDIFLAGMSTVQRPESMLPLSDKCIQRRTTLKEFLDHYRAILQQKHEEEAKADFETWHKQPALKSPSPFGKQMVTIHTHAVFKKFQVEVLGVVACHPKRESKEGDIVTYKVQDFEENHEFTVVWNDRTSDISCSCLFFEYNGFLCRHTMIVLQISGVHDIPSQYILKRWTKDAKSRRTMERKEVLDSRIQRYNNLCQQALKLGDEGSLCQESYNIVLNALQEALMKCESLNDSRQGMLDPRSPVHGLHNFEQVIQSRGSSRTIKNMNGNEKEQLNSRVMSPDGYFGNQQLAQGMGQLNAIAINHDDYYTNQQDMQGMLNSVEPVHDSHYLAPQGPHGPGNIHFGPQATPGRFQMQDSWPVMDQSNVGRTSLPGLASIHLQPEHLPQ